MPKKEIWKKCFQNDKYSVSNTGKVRYDVTGKIKKSQLDKDGYERVNLYDKSKCKTISVHRLVLTNFTKNNINLQVNHKDFNKRNNNLENLEWVTVKENIQYNHKHGKAANVNGIRNPMSKLTTQQVCEIAEGWQCKSNVVLAKEYNVDVNVIENIRNGTTYKELTGVCRDRYYKGIYRD